jgi:serine/threonine protein kinase/WD40 repeat protein/tetratricopeptide (TPR) repeat protein
MPADSHRIKELFVAALEIAGPNARLEFLDRECAGDPEMRRRLDVLLQAHDQPVSALERPLAGELPTGIYERQSEAPGTVIAGRYKLLESIGEGGMGEVWVAEQTQPVRRKVALKLIKAGMDSKSVLARFEAERQALAMMDHPNIAKVLDGGLTDSSRPYFVMEYVKGVPITEYCDATRLSVNQRLELFAQVCHAVQHAHQKGIIHRDLKPSNILVAPYDDRPVPKVIDFGLAKAMHQALTERTLHTAHETVLGTPLYMSPEQAQLNNLDVDTRSDIYSLGVLLYELLTGTTPVERRRMKEAAWDEVRRIIREEEPPRPSTRLSSTDTLPSLAACRQIEPAKLTRLIRGELDWIVMKALEKDRTRRYETANGFAADVMRYLAGEQVQAVPPSAGYRFRKFVRQNKARLAAATIVFLTLVLGIAATSLALVRALDAEQQARDERDAANDARAAETEQRKKAEELAAKVAIKRDLDTPDDRLRLLRLCRTLTQVPMEQHLREFLSLNILSAGQFSAETSLRPPLLHDLDVTSETVGPDGRLILTVGRDGTARVWDAENWRQLFILRPDAGDFRSAEFVAGGKAILAFDSANNLIVWDAASGQRLGILGSEPGKVLLSERDALVNSTCDRVVTHSHGKSELRLWELRTGGLVRTLPGPVYANYPWLAGLTFTFSPDGTLLLATGPGGNSVTVWAANDGMLVRDLGAFPQHSSIGIGFSPDGRSAYAWSTDEVRVWETSTWKLRRVVHNQRGSGFGSDLAFFGEDIISLTNYKIGSEEKMTLFHGTVLDFAVAEVSGDLLLTDDGALADTHTGSRLPVPPTRRFHPDIARFAKDGRFLRLRKGQLIDIKVDEPVYPFSESPRFADSPKQMGSGPEWLYLRQEGAGIALFEYMILLPSIDHLPDTDTLSLWGRVVARGELDASDSFKSWDEPTWEANRQELVRRARPMGRVPFPGPAGDPLYWAKSSLAPSIPNNTRGDPISLLDRLVAAEPTWKLYDRRAGNHFGNGHIDLGFADEQEAARLAGKRYWWDHGCQWCAYLVKSPGKPVGDYRLAVKSLEASRAALSSLGRPDNWRSPILVAAYYRAGQYAEAIALADQFDCLAAEYAVAGLMSQWVLPIQLQINNFTSDLFDESVLAYRAMSHWQLGDKTRARASLALARRIPPRDPRGGPASDAIAEATALIEGPAKH